jgi:hypothetical protein
MTFVSKFIFRKPEIIFEEPITDEPAVFLSNHSATNGPAFMSLYFPVKHKTWIIGYVLDKKKSANFEFHDFFFARGRKCKWFWRLLSHIVAPVLRPLLRNADPIPVYHDARLATTFRESLKTLGDGKSLVIFPERPKRFSEYISNLYSGFAELGALYYTDCGKKLKFYPVYVAHKLRKIMVGKPIEYDPSVRGKIQRETVSDYIRDNIDRLARSLPPHKSTPFLTPVWYKAYGEYEENTAAYWKLFD